MFKVTSSADGRQTRKTFDQLNKMCGNKLNEDYFSPAFKSHVVIVDSTNIFVERESTDD